MDSPWTIQQAWATFMMEIPWRDPQHSGPHVPRFDLWMWRWNLRPVSRAFYVWIYGRIFHTAAEVPMCQVVDHAVLFVTKNWTAVP